MYIIVIDSNPIISKINYTLNIMTSDENNMNDQLYKIFGKYSVNFI